MNNKKINTNKIKPGEGATDFWIEKYISIFNDWKDQQPYPFAQPNLKMMIPTSQGTKFLKLEDILFFKADGSYTEIHAKNNLVYIVSKHLKEFDSRLKEPPFVRPHRSYIVNLNSVTCYVKGRKSFLMLENETKIDVSPRRKEFINRVLKIYFY